MQFLGHTRSAHRADHMLHTPDAFVRASWAGMRNAIAIVHASPAIGAKFTQYTAEFEEGGELPAATDQRVLFVLEGKLKTGAGELGPGDYAYWPAEAASQVTALTRSRAAVIEKPYVPVANMPAPSAFSASEGVIKPQPLMGDPDLEVRSLIPADPAFDFALNTMTFRPGSALPMVEVHVMEHGLLFLGGGGIYRLNDSWYPVTEGDFIYMAPFCPQWFGAIGKTPAKYLIYKDWNRP